MGGIARLQGDLDLAESHLRECLELRQQTDDRWGQAITLLELAGVSFMRENYEAARLRCEEGLVAGDSSGDLQTTAHLLTGLSLCHRELGQYAQAEVYVRRSLETYEALSDQYGILQACLTLGELCRQLGDLRSAGGFCERAVLVSQEIGDRSGEADGRYRLGQIAAGLGDRASALRQLRLALVLADEIGETLTILDILLEIACLLADEDIDRSGQILALLINHPQLPDQRRARATSALARLAADAPVHTAPTPAWAEILSLAGAEK
jgi:tetratricopeptide (TPR) repeat protein